MHHQSCCIALREECVESALLLTIQNKDIT